MPMRSRQHLRPGLEHVQRPQVVPDGQRHEIAPEEGQLEKVDVAAVASAVAPKALPALAKPRRVGGEHNIATLGEPPAEAVIDAAARPVIKKIALAAAVTVQGEDGRRRMAGIDAIGDKQIGRHVHVGR